MIHVIAIITTKPGRRDDVLTVFKANLPAVHAEEGCIEYFPTIDVSSMGAVQTDFGSDTFVVLEKWTSVSALEAHMKAPHMVAYGARVKDMIANRVIHVVEKA